MKSSISTEAKNRIIRIVLLAFGLVLIAFLLLLDNEWSDPATGFSFRCEDESIVITKDGLDGSDLITKTVTVKDSDGNTVFSGEINFWHKELAFTSGEHGQKYNILVDNKITGTNLITAERVFVDYDEVNEIPILEINTADNQDPAFEEAEPVEGVWGHTIVNNDYSSATLNLISDGKESSLTTKVKVRGNTSALKNGKVPYRLKLDKKTDFGYFENSSKNWVLLNSGNTIKTIAGYSVCESLGMDWVPELMPVNVVMNGDWKGVYYLIEAVERKASDNLVSKKGYIFENDAYWWNVGDAYIKTSNQPYPLGYTFVYPKIDSGEQEDAVKLKNYLEEVESLIYNGDEAYADYIDRKSFAQWIMVRDVMGNADAGGTNMYYYIDNFDSDDTDRKLIHMGPLWDFDMALKTDDDWSACRYMEGNWFPELFEMESFNEEYESVWDKHKDDILPDLKKKFSRIEKEYGDSYSESIALDQTRWDKDPETYEMQKETLFAWIADRLVWMEDELDG